MRYCCGFAFDTGRRHVVLIEKKKPEWQKGKLNGVGGKVEAGEVPLQAMTREFAEETGIYVPHIQWTDVAILEGQDWRVHFYQTTLAADARPRTMTDEEVSWYRVESVLRREDLMPNLRVLIPLALDTSGIRRPVMLEDIR